MTTLLPHELWRLVIRFATIPEYPSDTICMKDSLPPSPTLYHFRHRSRNPLRHYTDLDTKLSISLVCRTFTVLVQEFLYEVLFINKANVVHKLADLFDGKESAEGSGKWTRQITLYVSSAYSPTSYASIVRSTERILQHTKRLKIFSLNWNAYSEDLRVYEEAIINALPSTIQHLEWHSDGGGFGRAPQHAFFSLLRRASRNLKVIKATGYLPLYDEDASLPSEDGHATPCEFTALRHLKVKRAIRDDLMLLKSWDLSRNLTCLNIGSIWSYLDEKEANDPFWLTPRPALQCLHLGTDAKFCRKLATKVLESASDLKRLEYFHLGNWDDHVWKDSKHAHLQDINIRVSHPTVSLRSLFCKRQDTREQRFEVLKKHIRYFLETGQEQTRSDSFPSLENLRFIHTLTAEDDTRKDELNDMGNWLRGAVREVAPDTINIEVEFTPSTNTLIKKL